MPTKKAKKKPRKSRRRKSKVQEALTELADATRKSGAKSMFIKKPTIRKKDQGTRE